MKALDRRPAVCEGESCDDLLHGEMKLIQRVDGYRYSADALLLSAFALPLCRGARVLDLGTGSGVIALILARRGRPAAVTGVETQPGLADIARRNAVLNKTRPRVKIIEADVLSCPFPAASFDLIVTNPPFQPAGSGPTNPDPERAIARHEIRMTLPEWLEVCRYALAPEGAACIVHPADQEKRLREAANHAGFHLRRFQRALDRPGGRPRLLLYDFRAEPGPVENLADVPIENEQGKFGIDGHR